MTAESLRTSSTHTRGAAPRSCVSGREGKGRDRNGRDVVPIHLQTVPGQVGEWMAANAAGTTR